MKKVVLHMSGVTNNSSAVRVEKNLKKHSKIKNASMDLKTNCLTIFCKEDLPIEDIEIEIDNLGYEVEPKYNDERADIVQTIIFNLIFYDCVNFPFSSL